MARRIDAEHVVNLVTNEAGGQTIEAGFDLPDAQRHVWLASHK